MTTTREFIRYNADGSLTKGITPAHCIKVEDCSFRKRIGGKFTIEVKDKLGNIVQHQECDNLIVNVGIQKIGDILAAVTTTNLDLGFIEPDAGTTCVLITDTDIQTPVDGTDLDRLAASSQTRNACSPFEVTISGFIGTTKWVRPFTINKMSVFFPPDETGTMFAAGKLSTPVTMTACQSATIKYAIFFR